MAAIGVFDSGVGGLTVLRSLKRRWPAENFIYLADTARLPYGTKSLNTVHNYVEQCLGMLKRYPLKAVVVACNTASAALIEQPLKFDVPVLNVVGPGARRAVEKSTSRRIGVLATRATVHSAAYVHAIQKLAPDAQVFQQPCPLFVPLVEEGWVDDPITNLIIYRYVSGVLRENIDTLIMGCTHYPALEAGIRRAVGPGIELVDSSQGIIEDLSGFGLSDSSEEGKTEILCTDFSPRLEETIRLLLGGLKVDKLETVDL